MDGAGTSASFGSALGWTVLGAVLPGTAFLAAGRRVLGAITLFVFLLLVGGGVWLATGGRRTVVRTAVDTDQLLWVVGGIALIALLWIVVVVAGYRMLLPARTGRGRHAAGRARRPRCWSRSSRRPPSWSTRLALTQRDLIAGVFDDDGESATVDDTPDPFGDQERVNVLLLGGDGGEGRDGVRTDTVIVASVDTDDRRHDAVQPAAQPGGPAVPGRQPAGRGLPRRLRRRRRRARACSTPSTATGRRSTPTSWVRPTTPARTSSSSASARRSGWTIDYFVLVNLDGFSRLVDALGGITVNVNYYVPVGGDPGTGSLPDDYIAPGPDQELDGATALAFARGRFGLTDYDRMARQRCTIDAIIDAADPVTLLRKYQELAATTKDIVSTDIPRSALDDFVDLALPGEGRRRSAASSSTRP